MSEQLLKEILGELKALNQYVGNMDQRIGNVEQRIGGLEQGQEELAGRMERMEALIENEIIDKIRALFDARAVHMDYFVSIRNSVARIEERVEHLARRQVETFIKLEEHDREIRLLRLEMSGH
jgi:predicted  nucleic acid-binding Zn-ribbon protein